MCVPSVFVFQLVKDCVVFLELSSIVGFAFSLSNLNQSISFLVKLCVCVLFVANFSVNIVLVCSL